MKVKNNKRKKAGQVKKFRIFVTIVVLLAVFAVGGYLYTKCVYQEENVSVYKEKLQLLEEKASNWNVADKIGASPAGNVADHVVFLSVSDTEKRATVITGTGSDLETAWENADEKMTRFLEKTEYEPVWVKADIVRESEKVGSERLKNDVKEEREEFFRYGVAFDDAYETALLESELNGAKIYNYEDGGFYGENLNRYLRDSGREQLAEYPDNYILFQTYGWFCDENNQVFTLGSEGPSYGRRNVETVDKEYALDLIEHASDYLVDQLNDDGTFIYGVKPRFNNEMSGYNMLRHAGTIWALICKYNIAPEDQLMETIQKSINYMISQVVYANDHTAYLYEAESDELKLGGSALAVIALTEYRNVFKDHQYDLVCQNLGNGILTMMDQETGSFYHVLNSDTTPKEEFRTIFYDGEAAFALCRLYGLDNDVKWYDAVMKAFYYFTANGYEENCSQWIAYSLNEITKYVDDPELYTLALKNFQTNVEKLHRETASPTHLELLGCVFETWQRLQEKGLQVEYAETSFDPAALLETIMFRIQRLLDNYFYPETAMYMEYPSGILNTFMVRNDGFRARIDDIQHSIGGLMLYYKNYEQLTK